MPEMINHKQMRAARVLLDMKQADAAKRAGLSPQAYSAIERGAAQPRASNLAAIQSALEQAGVEFIAENGGGPGVRLRK